MHACALCNEEIFLDLDDDIYLNDTYCEQWEDKRKLAAYVFSQCLYEVLLDIIENNSIFVLPLRGKDFAEIFMKTIDGDTFKKMYNGGSFQRIDYVKSQFSGNRLMLGMSRKSRQVDKCIYVDIQLQKKIDEYTNQGRKYY